MKPISFKKHIFFALVYILCTLGAFAQHGNYYINNYTPSSYGAGDQNWNIIQDSLGRLFVANNDAVMMYDGRNWHPINITDGSTVSSVAKTKNNILLVGGVGDFGYLNTNNATKIKYVSLKQSLPDKEKTFGKIWAIHSIDSNRFFCANEKIFWYINNRFIKSFVPTGEKFHTFFNVQNTLLVREQGVGFLFFKNGDLKKINNTEEFADTKIYAIISYKENLYWVCSRKGLFILKYNNRNPEQSSFSKINSPATDKWMIENDVYCGTKINHNQYAIGSLKNGVLIVDNNFNPVSNVNSSQSGLQEDAVKCIYIDYAGNMWLALNKGISHVQINTPLKHWNKINGIRGTIESVTKYNGTFYIASDKGVDALNKQTNTFMPTGITENSWDLLPYKNSLFAATDLAVYEINANNEIKIFDADDKAYKLFVNPTNKEQLFIAGENSLLLTKYADHKLTVLKEYAYAEGIRSIAADVQGNVFFGSNKIYLFKPSAPDTLTVFAEQDSISPTAEHYVFTYNKEVLVATEGGLLQYRNKASPHFIINPVYNIFKGKFQIEKAIQVENDIWTALLNISDNSVSLEGDGVSILKRTAKGFEKEYKFFKQIKSLKPHCFFVDSGRVYIGTNDGLISYNLKQPHEDYVFNTFISKVIQRSDTNIISENIYEGLNKGLVFSYKDNEISFAPSASDYYDKNELEFCYYLEGVDEGYGGYTKFEKKPYNNLHEGHYVFHIKSRNILGIEGKSVSFAFTVLPPWYRTIWAYILYVIGLVAFISFIVRYNTKRLKEQNIKLEKIITERTKTVEHQKEEIEYKNKEITDSINYAQRIQQAILPPVFEIKKVWNDLFVFYQPKDIVSGDFYWFHKISDTEILIACADCTGHGVPGGFMSMICSDKLNDAAQKTSDPAEILFHVNNNVKKALRQTETSDENVNKDGMEIALLRVNFSSKKLWFAGANRLLWVLRKDNQDIEEIKPNKASIASFTELNFKYTGHEMQLNPGDLVYVTSDGYPDQFGGAQGKKFMTKTLKKLILSIRNKEIFEQEIIIKNTINEWMQGYEQVDDLLLIAFKM